MSCLVCPQYEENGTVAEGFFYIVTVNTAILITCSTEFEYTSGCNPGIYAEGNIVFVFWFVCSYVSLFVCPFVLPLRQNSG